VAHFDVGDITLEGLRQRQSLKYRQYPPEVIPAWVAEMDFPLAEPIAEALHAAIDRSDTGYRSAEGVAEALCSYATRSWRWQVDPADVGVIPDVVSGLIHALNVLTEPGDGVVINPPVYPPFFTVVRDIAKRVIVEVPMVPDDDGVYGFDLDGLEVAFSRPEVTAYVMSSPHNPTGTVPARESLEVIAALALAHDVAVISDEIHAPLVLPGAEHVPYLQVAGPDSRALMLMSASKSWNIPGLKCAQIVATPALPPQASRLLPIEVAFGTGHLGAIANVAAYESGGEWLDQVRGILDGNRRLIADLLAQKAPDVGYVPPEASYLAWLDMRACGLGDDPTVQLLEQGRIALNAGPAFGAVGRGHARLNFGTSPDLVAEIVDRLARVVQ
jgi:cystathionine beta-lyase